LDYETEEQQVEALKKWWAENGKSVILGVGIGAFAIFGWQGWNKHQLSKARQASDGYQQTLAALNGEGDAVEIAKDVKDDHSGTLYATMAALAAARSAVEKSDLETAEKELRWAVSNSPQKEISTIARVRLARVQGALGKHKDAFKTLPGKAPEAFTALVEEVRGDLYSATGEAEKARVAYQAALDSGESGGDRNTLEMKLNELAVADSAN